MDAWFHSQDWGEMTWLVLVPAALILGMVLTSLFNDMLKR
jgi:hypothetical protein